MPSVTEVLDYLTEPELLNWFRNNSKKKCEEISKEACRIGSAVDALVQQDIREDGYLVPEDDSPIVNCMKGWEKFKRDYPKFVPSVKYMQKEIRQGEIVGHPDFIRDEIFRWGITDLKCSSGIRPRYWTQTAKYLNMEQVTENRGQGGFISVLRLDKNNPDGDYEYREITNQNYIQYELEIFNAYHLAFNHNKRNRETIRQILEAETLGG